MLQKLGDMVTELSSIYDTNNVHIFWGIVSHFIHYKYGGIFCCKRLNPQIPLHRRNTI